jgi:hypothetical protein
MTTRTPFLIAVLGAIACGQPRTEPPPASPTEIPIAPATVTSSAPATPTATATATAQPPATAAAGDTASNGYTAQLAQFFASRLQVPTGISVADARRLCVTFQANVSRAMVIWHVTSQPRKSSGNPSFDDAARAMLEKLVQDRTKLPEPPPEVADLFRGRMLVLALLADPAGDVSSCR